MPTKQIRKTTHDPRSPQAEAAELLTALGQYVAGEPGVQSAATRLAEFTERLLAGANIVAAEALREAAAATAEVVAHADRERRNFATPEGDTSAWRSDRYSSRLGTPAWQWAIGLLAGDDRALVAALAAQEAANAALAAADAELAAAIDSGDLERIEALSESRRRAVLVELPAAVDAADLAVLDARLEVEVAAVEDARVRVAEARQAQEPAAARVEALTAQLAAAQGELDALAAATRTAQAHLAGREQRTQPSRRAREDLASLQAQRRGERVRRFAGAVA